MPCSCRPKRRVPIPITPSFRNVNLVLGRNLATAGALVHGEAWGRSRVLAGSVWVCFFLFFLGPADCGVSVMNFVYSEVGE